MFSIICGLAQPGHADETVTVSGKANIYGAGHASPPVAGFGGSGDLPPVISFSAGAGQTLEIVSATGTVLLDAVTNNAGIGPSGPDGGPFYAPTDVTSTGGLAGIQSNVTGFLTGVFLDDSEPTGGGPAVLDFTSGGLGTNFTTLSPLIGQVFFIGNGRTSSGAVQKFQIPSTATRLFLGVVDAADGDNAAGPPQAYGDNGGSFTTTVRIEPKITRIVYHRNGDLIAMDADGGNKQNLTSGAYFTELAEMSADGKFIAFRGTRAAPAPGGGFLSGIWVMKSEPVGAGNVPVLVSPNSNYGYNLSWHPDGRHLAIGEYVTSSPTVTVLRVRDETGAITPESAGNVAVRMLVRSADYYYSGGNFSPDGRYLAVSNKAKQIFLLRAFNSSGELTPESAANPLAKVGLLDTRNLAGTPEWSPDARSVVFPQITLDSGFANPVSRLAVLKVRDSAGNPLAEGAGNARVNFTEPVAGNYTTVSPSWSADGAKIAFAWAPDNVSFYNTYTILAGEPENATTNPKVLLTSNAEGGTLTPSFAAAGFVPADSVPTYGVVLSGLKNGQFLPPKTNISLKAAINPAPSAGVTISNVRFYINGDPAGATDSSAPYTYNSLVEAPGERIVTAVATDSQGGTVTSAPLKFTVTPAGAGPLALRTEILPAGATFAPGQLVTYRLLATNTSTTGVAKDVKLVTPVPQRTKYNKAGSYDENGAKLSPAPKVSDNKKEVTFDLGDIPAGKTYRADLVVRVPYDAAAGGDAIRNTHFNITGKTDKSFSGNFGVLSRMIAGAPPANSPRLSLIKTIVDLAEDKNDELDMIEDEKLGSIPGAGPGDVLSFVLVVSNYGGLPAEKVSVTDRVPAGCKLVPKSVRVNDVSAGALLEVNGRTLNFQLGNVAANKFAVISYQLEILGSGPDAPKPGATLYSVGAEVGAMNLQSRSDSAPERLPIRIEEPVEVRVSHFSKTGGSEVGKPTTYVMNYRNEGTRIARGAKIINPAPQGTKYRPGSAVIRNKKAGQSIDVSKSGVVTFNLGDVPPESGGSVEVAFDVKASVLDLALPEVVNRPYIGTSSTKSDLVLPGSSSAKEAAKGYIAEDRNPVLDLTIPKLFVARIAPQSVQKGNQFIYQIIVGNSSDLEVGGVGGVVFEIPKGAQYLSSSAGIYSASGNKYFASFNHFTGNAAVKFPAHSARMVTVLLKATGAVGDVIKDSTCYLYSKDTLEVYVPPAATMIIDGDARTSTNQVRIAGAQLGALGLDSSVAMLDDRVAAAVGQINDESVSTRIGGASYVQMTNGALLVPLLGEDKILAIGPASLIGNDGSTLIGNDGSTLVAAGGGNLITFNGLIGNDGSTLVGQDGSTIMSKIRTNDPANLVAAGGGNLVAAGGGNLVGNDGASLIGNDGSTLAATIASFLSGPNPAYLVAAGGGNFLGDTGKGLLVTDAATVLLNNSEALVAAGGGNLFAAGGGSLGAALSRDKSMAVSFNRNGSLTVGGGGSPPVGK